MTATDAAYLARGRQAISEALHRLLMDYGIQTDVRVRLVADLRAVMVAQPRLAMAFVVAGTGPDGKPRAEIATAADPRPVVMALPVGKWRLDFKRELRAEFKADPGHPTIQ